MRKLFSYLLSIALLLSPIAAVPQCVVPANGAVIKTTDYPAVSGDLGKLLIMNCTTACTVTLPSTIQSPIRMLWVETIGTGEVTIARNGKLLNNVAADF